MEFEKTKVIRIIPDSRGLTLIELIVSLSVFSLITIAILAVFSSAVGSYHKSRVTKNLKESTEYALNSIAKDIRMGKIEDTAHSDGMLDQCLMLTRNRGGKICYCINTTAGSSYLGIIEGLDDSDTSCPAFSSSYKKLIDLTDKNMDFESGTSGFHSCPSAISDSEECPAGNDAKRRGWAQINLNIKAESGSEMEADSISVQTIVSSRDYGWEMVP